MRKEILFASALLLILPLSASLATESAGEDDGSCEEQLIFTQETKEVAAALFMRLVAGKPNLQREIPRLSLDLAPYLASISAINNPGSNAPIAETFAVSEDATKIAMKINETYFQPVFAEERNSHLFIGEISDHGKVENYEEIVLPNQIGVLNSHFLVHDKKIAIEGAYMGGHGLRMDLFLYDISGKRAKRDSRVGKALSLEIIHLSRLDSPSDAYMYFMAEVVPTEADNNFVLLSIDLQSGEPQVMVESRMSDEEISGIQQMSIGGTNQGFVAEFENGFRFTNLRQTIDIEYDGEVFSNMPTNRIGFKRSGGATWLWSNFTLYAKQKLVVHNEFTGRDIELQTHEHLENGKIFETPKGFVYSEANGSQSREFFFDGSAAFPPIELFNGELTHRQYKRRHLTGLVRDQNRNWTLEIIPFPK